MSRVIAPALHELYGPPARLRKLDRLGWKGLLVFTCYGARMAIRVNDPTLLERLLPRLPPGWKSSSSPVVDYLYSLYVRERRQPGAGRYHALYAESARIGRALDVDALLEKLETALHFHVAVSAREKLFVHAGVVGWRGKAIVIPGQSMSGKTTLVAELVRAGATYYSDEYAVFDADARVHPYARPLCVREESPGRSTRYPVEALGGHAGAEPLSVGLVVITDFTPGTTWCPRVLTSGQALLALMKHLIHAPQRLEVTLGMLRPVALNATTLGGIRGEARDIVPTLLSVMEGSALKEIAT